MTRLWELVKVYLKRFFLLALEVILFNGNYFPQFAASTFKQEMKYFSCVLCCKGTYCEEFYVGISCSLWVHVFLCFSVLLRFLINQFFIINCSWCFILPLFYVFSLFDEFTCLMLSYNVLQNLDWIFLKIDLNFLTLNDFKVCHKIQAISYDKLFYLLKIFPKSCAFSKKLAFIFEHVIDELCSQVTFNKFVFFKYLCVVWLNHHMNMTRHPPLRRVKIFYGESCTLFLTSFSYLSVLFRNTFKKVSSQMQVHSLSHINWRLHSIYLWNVAILFQFMFCKKKKKIVRSLFLMWYIFFGYCQEVFFTTVFRHEKVMEFILLNFVATL